MTIRRQQFRDGSNRTFTSEATKLGQRLAELVDSGATEAAIAKENFSQDGLGQWFAKTGEQKVVLDKDIQTQTLTTVPIIVSVPTPASLQPALLGRQQGS